MLNRVFMIEWYVIRAATFGRCVVLVLWFSTGLGFLGVSSCSRSGDDGSKNEVRRDSSLPVIKEAPFFSGIDQQGSVLRSNQLLGKIWIASFMFTSCQGVCPVMNGELQKVQREFESFDIRFVSFTVDPETDSQQALAEYGKRYSADVRRWSFVRMNIDSVRSLSKTGFLLSDPFEPSAHSSRYVLVDKKNRIRGYYDCMDSVKVVELKRDIRILQQE